MSHALPLPSKLLPPILKQWSFDDSIPHTIEQLKQLPVDADTFKDLQAMNVTKIGQYRSDQVMHEHVVVEFAYQPDEAKPTLFVDTRVARIERFKCDNGKSGKLDSSPLIQDIIQASKSQWKLDNISISNTIDIDMDIQNSPGVVRPGYNLLRSFSPAPGSLNLLQLLAIVNAVSSTASDYSSLHHMCFWFATSVYLATRQYISFTGTEFISPHLSKAGTFKHFKLVNPLNGAITFDFGSTRVLDDLYNNYFAQGVSHEVLLDLMEIVAKDEALLKKEGNLQLLAVSSIVTAARLQQDLLYKFFVTKCQAVQDRLKKEELKQEADRKRLEVAEAGQVSERKKAEDERKKAEAERKKAEAEHKKAEAERERAEAAEAGQAAERKKAEAERKRAEAALEEVAALRRLLGQKKQ